MALIIFSGMKGCFFKGFLCHTLLLLFIFSLLLSLAPFVCSHSFSHSQLFVTPWTVAHQASTSMEFSRQEYWSSLPFPIPGHLPNPGIKPVSLCISCIGRKILYHRKGRCSLHLKKGILIKILILLHFK